ncbi:uncharacterized protein EKO05_0004088 [Ascochyta rabiei]|uniref:Uncharacterized protein n=1 Tax=Didymella rabiei TaxID=5454 RepID=A0A162XYS6_DIDRA|nr:uncharacterized protein EKO05_0004088 [Ascochyta rabiei]KZM19745.1 hypothetical protein ST47_g9229 [Ascochyta rabiei]UPX13586.1 hypothetical protein EKO05_0004088 [Ascochyta rabiei]
MAPFTTNPVDTTNTLRTLLRRASLCDSYTPCQPHRTAVLIVIISIGFLTSSILLFYYLRKRTSVHPGPTRFKPGLVHPHRMPRKRESTTQRRDDEDPGLELPRYEPQYDAPPPYVCGLARPEDVHVHGARTNS